MFAPLNISPLPEIVTFDEPEIIPEYSLPNEGLAEVFNIRFATLAMLPEPKIVPLANKVKVVLFAVEVVPSIDDETFMLPEPPLPMLYVTFAVPP